MSNKIANQNSSLIEVSTSSIDWNKQAAISTHRIKLDEVDNHYFFLRARLAARKLHASSKRAACVGVFGPSQAGKSYLVSALAKPTEGNLMVQLGDQQVDFLQKINPGGGRESTGVVTRFSLSKPETQDPSFPVEIRLLSESDLLKILFNSFFSDFDHAGSLTLPALEPQKITERLEKLKVQANFKNESLSIRQEDILDLRDYLQNSFGNLTHNLQTDFWPSAIATASFLTIEQRADLFAVVWRDYPIFTELYKVLAYAVEKLKGADICLAPLNAVVSEQGQTGIVDAQLLSELGQPNGGQIDIRPVLNGQPQSPLSMPKSVIAALTAELRLPLPSSRWTFANHLDILDFPGARSRLKISDPQKSEGNANTLAAELFLRGKVAFLFQRYTADQELSTVLLCVPWGPQEVTGYAPLIDQWVRDTNGASSDKRAKVPAGLLLVMTKFDMDLQAKGGDNESTERQRWPDRIKSSLLERFGSMDWVDKWTDANAFNNIFWLRNPEIKDSAYMKYDKGVEIDINPDHRDRLLRLRLFFCEDQLVKKHFSSPEQAWDAAMKPQDGGISRIVDGINLLANPHIRIQTLQDKTNRLSDSMHSRLKQYFSEGQGEELAKKQEIFNTVKNDLVPVIRNNDIWQVLENFILDLDELKSLYFKVASGNADSIKSADAASSNSSASSAPDFDLDDFLSSAIDGPSVQASSTTSASTAAVHPRALNFADKVVEFWISKIRNYASADESSGASLMPSKGLTLLVEELAISAQRYHLNHELATVLHAAESNAGTTWEKIADRQATIARNIIGDFVSQLGMSHTPMSERPGIPLDKPQRRIFEPFPAFNGPTPPLQEVPIAVSMLYVRDWLVGLQKTIMDNAGFAGSEALSPELNIALGKLIKTIQAGGETA
jgi:hypothetical protein